MASHIDIPPPLSMPEPTIAPDTQPIGPADPQPQVAFVTAYLPGVVPAQSIADYHDAVAQPGMLISCFTGSILIRLPGGNYGDPSDRLWMMYMVEAENASIQTTQSWNKEAERILLFVRTLSSIF